MTDTLEKNYLVMLNIFFLKLKNKLCQMKKRGEIKSCFTLKIICYSLLTMFIFVTEEVRLDLGFENLISF